MMWHIIRHPNEPESVLTFLFRPILLSPHFTGREVVVESVRVAARGPKLSEVLENTKLKREREARRKDRDTRKSERLVYR